MIIYAGPSMLDGAPIVAIATGLARKSRNRKTGQMVQVFILRQDMHPSEALASGADASICGDCPLRNGACYVDVAKAPASVWRAYRNGRYPHTSPSAANSIIRRTGLGLRLGAYGDPAAVPFHVWRDLSANVKTLTGYTHQWRRFPEFAALVMASADNPAEAISARMLGFRTFRVRLANETLQPKEIDCLADRGVSCADCGLCDGRRDGKRSIAIVAHGAKNKIDAFAALRAA